VVETVVVAVATPLDAELVPPIRAVDPRVEVLYEPHLLPPTRYPGDHRGTDGFVRSPEAERRWRHMLDSAQVLFGLPGDSPSGLAAAVRGNPGLSWVQGTAAGAGEQVRAAGLTEEELRRVTITSARGIHAIPLAEFCLLGLLAFTKDLPRLESDQRARRWHHHPVRELHGQTLLILGLGAVGEEVARLAKAFGMRVVGINRHGRTDSPDVDEIHPLGALDELLGEADAVVITLPNTTETAGLLDADSIARLKPGSILVNVGRGAVIDEPALIEALRAQRLRGAALDVFATEPLPADSPLWELPNVLVSPHTAALSIHENERIVELFVQNLGRYLAGQEFLNRVDTSAFY
jgi:phosphoglycerate dehydrogenase-like enzyme